MKKIIVIAASLSIMLVACSKKKDEVAPSTGSGSIVVGNQTPTAKSWNEKAMDAANSISPTVSNVTANSSMVTLGEQNLFVEKEGDEVYVSQVSSVNGRISKKVLAGGSGANGKFVGIMCVITPNNVHEFVNWISKKSPNPFEEIFGKAFYQVFQGGPDGKQPDIQLNTSNLPKGVFALNGKVTAKKVGTCSGTDCGQIGSYATAPAKVDATGDAGLFQFFANDQAYGEFRSSNATGWSFMSTTEFGKGDYIVANGERYEGNKNSKLAEGFVWMIGIGKGTSTPPMTGIVWAVGYKKAVQKVIFTLGVFQGLKVK